MALNIAIDGPVGAGKTSVARALAERLGIAYLDTGATYRALALKTLREGVDPRDTAAAEALAMRTDIGIRHDGTTQRMFVDGEDVTSLLRTPDVTMATSAISMAAGVRARMVALQRAYAADNAMVLDGRDVGTRVLPGATHKFFLTAAPEVRAKRRHLEMIAKGEPCDYAQVLRDLRMRDRQDSEREVDPLRQAEDAVLIDSSDLSEQEVLAQMIRIIGEDAR